MALDGFVVDPRNDFPLATFEIDTDPDPDPALRQAKLENRRNVLKSVQNIKVVKVFLRTCECKNKDKNLITFQLIFA
jgi:hypothetical protein